MAIYKKTKAKSGVMFYFKDGKRTTKAKYDAAMKRKGKGSSKKPSKKYRKVSGFKKKTTSKSIGYSGQGKYKGLGILKITGDRQWSLIKYSGDQIVILHRGTLASVEKQAHEIAGKKKSSRKKKGSKKSSSVKYVRTRTKSGSYMHWKVVKGKKKLISKASYNRNK